MMRSNSFPSWLAAILFATASMVMLGKSAGSLAAAENGATQASGAYVTTVSDVTAKVGEHTVLRATLRPREGYRILKAYVNHVGQLSSSDGDVAFDHKVFNATPADGALVFEIGLTPTKAGKHPINGVFRVGYIQDSEGDMAMVSIPLIANVTGTE